MKGNNKSKKFSHNIEHGVRGVGTVIGVRSVRLGELFSGWNFLMSGLDTMAVLASRRLCVPGIVFVAGFTTQSPLDMETAHQCCSLVPRGGG